MPDPFLNVWPTLPATAPGVTSVQRHTELSKVLAYIGRSIDDVINDPIARNQVWGYFKLLKQINRSSEVGELERQWNGRL